jgi:hypothetical protein
MGLAGSGDRQAMRRSAREPWVEVIGVVDDVRHDGLEQPTSRHGVPAAQRVARTARGPTDELLLSAHPQAGTAALLADVSKAVSSVSDRVPIGGVQTLGELNSSSTARTSLTLFLLGIIGSMALLLGVIGVYAVIRSPWRTPRHRSRTRSDMHTTRRGKSRIDHVARVASRRGLEDQHVCLQVRNRPMLHTSRHDDEFSRTDLH